MLSRVRSHAELSTLQRRGSPPRGLCGEARAASGLCLCPDRGGLCRTRATPSPGQQKTRSRSRGQDWLPGLGTQGHPQRQPTHRLPAWATKDIFAFSPGKLCAPSALRQAQRRASSSPGSHPSCVRPSAANPKCTSDLQPPRHGYSQCRTHRGQAPVSPRAASAQDARSKFPPSAPWELSHLPPL